jgi:20S proteasome subunit alpha 5
MTVEEAETLCLFILRQVMEEKLNSQNVEIATARMKDKKFAVHSVEETEAIIARLPAPALPQLSHK